MSMALQPLTNLLHSHFGFNLSRIKCLVMLIEGLIQYQTVNLARLSSGLSGKAKPASHYTRLRRFMKEIMFYPGVLAKLLVAVMGVDLHQSTVILDRTNWKFGKRHINLLYLAVAWNGLAIPLFWALLEGKQQGNSDHLDRIDLVECLIQTFGKAAIGVILGDREFIGKHWINYLAENNIPYVLRLKDDGQYLSNARGQMVKICHLFRALPPGTKVSLGQRKVGKVDKQPLHCTASRSGKGELLVVVHASSTNLPIESYAKRWGIETMFKALKSSGFDMEATHITDVDRLDTLFGIMAIAFCVACKAGEISVAQTPILIKKHGRQAQSVFRRGMDVIKHILANMNKNFLVINVLQNIASRKINPAIYCMQKNVRY